MEQADRSGKWDDTGSSLLFPSTLLSRRCSEKQSLLLGDVNELANSSNLLSIYYVPVIVLSKHCLLL